jgi:hypothetical protein
MRRPKITMVRPSVASAQLEASPFRSRLFARRRPASSARFILLQSIEAGLIRGAGLSRPGTLLPLTSHKIS